MAVGRRLAAAMPRAKKAPARSSRWTQERRRGSTPQRQRQRRGARAGADDDVADTAVDQLLGDRAKRSSRRPDSLAHGSSPPSARPRRLQLRLGFLPFALGLGVGHDAAAGQERGAAVDHDARPKRHDELAVAVAVDPAERPGEPAALERLLLGDELERQVARRTGDGGGGMEQLGEPDDARPAREAGPRPA